MVVARANTVLGPIIRIVKIIAVLLMATIVMKGVISSKDLIDPRTIIVKVIMALTDQIVIIKINIVEVLKAARVVIAKITDPEENMVLHPNMDDKVGMNHVEILTIVVVAVEVMTIAVLLISVLIIDHVVNMAIGLNMVGKVEGVMTIMNENHANSMIEADMVNKELCAPEISEIIVINKIIAVVVVAVIIIAIQ